ncbi:bridging integrator 3 isoform X15 [Apodemus sylvaticus]|uniref:bridging integrator 3 isoform X12 n=1 Tax=Apodemus sylvaticus TaxID=10129 RepID=UPI00224478B3|nr:bridging integrator 3 isoform X12 [Apodemus sylvaticus]XP_052047003.1 bridging integrator 3 isoform X13 [Apodemus sylvaticus]XP_052047004.1 bridging integrator 3 isoform X14 [Apodemus sylvaticus]XP_052047005.1 bridging integrator 3 isoform X15 [Apodemus sylvaticus]
MSWIPFKIGQPKKQIVSKTVERDFEREYGKLQQLEEQTKRLQKDMKKSTDADLAMSKSAVKISLDLLSNPLCEQDQDFLRMVTALDTAMKRMDAFNQEKVNQIQKTVIEPLKKFSSIFPSLNMAVKRREQALQDYGRLQAKVEKYEEKEKTGPVLAKLHQAREELRPVREDFEAKNKQLLDEMPRFYGSRLDYFQPSFESLIRAQVIYYSEMHTLPPPRLYTTQKFTPCLLPGHILLRNSHLASSQVIYYSEMHTSCLLPGHILLRNAHLLPPPRSYTTQKCTPCLLPGHILLRNAHLASSQVIYYSEMHTSCLLPGHILLRNAHLASSQVIYYSEMHTSCLLPGHILLRNAHLLPPPRSYTTQKCTPLASSQVIYYSEMHKIFGDLTQQLEQPGHSDEQRERENETKLSELRALSIVADD